jgi:hypothetical protein
LEVAREREGERYGRVDVSAGEVTGCVDHDHDDEPEHEGYTHSAERTVVVGIRDDRAAAREDKREGCQPLCESTAWKVSEDHAATLEVQ